MSSELDIGSALQGNITLKIKRAKQTYYINCNLKDKVSKVKQLLKQQLEFSFNDKEDREFKLYKLKINDMEDNEYVELDDNDKLELAGLEDNSTIYFVFETKDGYEKIHYETPTILNYDSEDSEDNEDVKA